jgi:16S rRNA C967 or C1407 C5-methylase (RsmB/RsmF family)
VHHLKGRSSFDSEESVPWCDSAYYLDQRPFFHLDPHWHGGAYYVQEASSMILDAVVSQLNLDDTPRIWLDMCAAPGGKTGILAKHLGPGDVMLANEIVGPRRSVLRENLTKAGYLNVFISGESGSSFREPFVDILLIDAPCAGEGMMRKEPEAIRQWEPYLVESCSLLQRQIVSDAVKSLKENGILIYSTCSYSMQENLHNIQHFESEFGLQSMSLVFPEEWGIATIQENSSIGYQLYPHRVKGEGLFISVLKNNSSYEPDYKKTKKPFQLFEPVPTWLTTHLADSGRYMVRKNNPQHQMITIEAETKANELLMHIPRADALAEAGEMKGRDFVPSPFLVMAGLQHSDYEVVQVNHSVALDYLERSINTLPPAKDPGWYVISFEGTLLGWAKNTAQGWKNHFPMNWRLRNRKTKE